jgi:hypothetical protein
MVLAGIGGMTGSMIGHAFGQTGLYAGGVLGGLIGASLAAVISAAAGWIDRSQRGGAAIGGAIGFVIAALIAVNTLSSPIGPVASTLLVGAGAVLGAKMSKES